MITFKYIKSKEKNKDSLQCRYFLNPSLFENCYNTDLEYCDELDCIYNYSRLKKYFRGIRKNYMTWAVQHLQSDNKEIQTLAIAIVNQKVNIK